MTLFLFSSQNWLIYIMLTSGCLFDKGTLVLERTWWSWVEIWTCTRTTSAPDCWETTQDFRTASVRPLTLMLVLQRDAAWILVMTESMCNEKSPCFLNDDLWQPTCHLFQGCEEGHTHISENPFTNTDGLVPFGGGVRIDYILFKVNIRYLLEFLLFIIIKWCFLLLSSVFLVLILLLLMLQFSHFNKSNSEVTHPTDTNDKKIKQIISTCL